MPEADIYDEFGDFLSEFIETEAPPDFDPWAGWQDYGGSE